MKNDECARNSAEKNSWKDLTWNCHTFIKIVHPRAVRCTAIR